MANKSALTLRRATRADLDGIANVVTAGYPDDPDCQYMYPRYREFPEDFWKANRKQYEGYIEQKEKYIVLVVAMSPIEPDVIEYDGDDSGDSVDGPREIRDKVIAAVGVWMIDVEVEHVSPGGNDNGIASRRDADARHIKLYNQITDRVEETYFGKYGQDRLQLVWCITHPDFRRGGAGSLICRYGEAVAAQRARQRQSVMTLTLLASPMGCFMYERLGYKRVGEVDIQAEGEEDRTWYFCMVKSVSG